MFIVPVRVLKPPQKPPDEGFSAGSSLNATMGSDASEMIGIDVSSMVTAFLSGSIASENDHGSSHRQIFDSDAVASVPEQAKWVASTVSTCAKPSTSPRTRLPKIMWMSPAVSSLDRPAIAHKQPLARFWLDGSVPRLFSWALIWSGASPSVPAPP